MKTMNKLIAVALSMVAACHSINAQQDMKNVLNQRQQNIVAIACLEAKGDLDNLSGAIHTGLDEGLTINEMKEILSHLYAYTGFPRSLNALGVLQQVLAERKTRGIQDKEGKETDPLPKEFNALKEGAAVQTKLIGAPFHYTFAPATDYYLKAHLFGDIFARNNLTFRERELVTVSALSGIKGAESQLKSHVSGAKNMGLTDAEIHAIPTVLLQKVGETESYRAKKAIAEVYGEAFKEGEPIENRVFPKGELNAAYARYFIGNSYLAELANGEGKLKVANVTFEPRCRNNWHIHHKGGQILICVGGRGWYQEWGKPARELHPGDVVDIPAETKHWHGAAADSWFQHIAIGVPAEGASAEWLEPVTDAEYDKLK